MIDRNTGGSFSLDSHEYLEKLGGPAVATESQETPPDPAQNQEKVLSVEDGQ